MGSNRPEQRRIADLAHQVDKTIVNTLPVERRKGMAFHLNTHGDILGDVLLAAERRPQIEIVDKLKEFEGRPVSYGKFHFEREAEAGVEIVMGGAPWGRFTFVDLNYRQRPLGHVIVFTPSALPVDLPCRIPVVVT